MASQPSVVAPTPAGAVRPPRWDGSRVLFEIIADGERVTCAISREALREISGRNHGKPADLLASFAQVRERVEAVAQAKYLAKSSASIGLLTVWSDDLEDEDAEAPAAPPDGPAGTAAVSKPVTE